MQKADMSMLLSVVLSLLLVTFTHSAAISDSVRVRRSSADQRIAELQALLALSGWRSRQRNIVAHGLFDPDAIGKRKRSGDLEVSEADRYNILRSLLTKAAMESTAK